MNDNQLSINQEVLLSIKRLGINGEGIGYYKKLAVFVDGAIPGEEIEVLITEVSEKFAKGKIKKIKKASADRVVPDCPFYDRCGGCQIQHMSYRMQLEEKRNMVFRAFEKYYEGDLSKTGLRETIGMTNPWSYRNKNQLPVRFNGEKIVTGLYAKQSNFLVYVDKCLVENELISKATENIRAFLTKHEIIAYNPKVNDGVLRHLIVRGDPSTNQVQVTLVLFKEDNRTKRIASDLLKIESVVSVFISINSDPKSIEIFGNETVYLAGERTVDFKLGEISFSLSPTTFFQLNSDQALVLYDEVKKGAALSGKENVVDGYCGVGAIGLWLSKSAKEVRGIDTNKESIESARETAIRNGVKNATFHTGNLLPHLDRWHKEGFKTDVFIVNPPRSGLDIRFIHYLQEHPVKKLIYVSCNPSTLAKNINHLQSSYKLRYVQPIDMFPQTSNIETIAVLEKR